MKHDYKIVRTKYLDLGFAVKVKPSWFPFYFDYSVGSMSETIEECERWIELHSKRGKTVKEFKGL